MKKTVIWHNPRCKKSRQTLEILQSKDLDIEVVEYLKTPPSESDLNAVAKKLNLEPSQFIRTKEAAYRELGLSEKSSSEMVAAMATHPILIERPIVVHGDKAVLGRPPENVEKLF